MNKFTPCKNCGHAKHMHNLKDWCPHMLKAGRATGWSSHTSFEPLYGSVETIREALDGKITVDHHAGYTGPVCLPMGAPDPASLRPGEAEQVLDALLEALGLTIKRQKYTLKIVRKE